MVLEIIALYPRVSIVVISILVSLFISLTNYFVLDKEKVKSSKEKQKELNKKMKEHKHDAQKLMELQKESFSHAMENMKHSFKPMLITIVPILIVFSLIRNTFAETTLAGSWFWYYLVSAIVASMIFRKLFKLP